MNKTFNINLGGYPFAIDENAFNFVQTYLEKIRKHFATSEGCDEILYDIEVRMAELFQEHLKGRSIVSMKEVDEIVMIMGKPEDFGAEPMDETYSNAQQGRQGSKTTYHSLGTGKRLFRDPDDKKVGGVCSGIAAYLGIADPLWIRLIFAAGLLLGLPAAIYVLLWMLVPEAKTSGDKLAMRGEATTINNIAKVIEDELSDLGSRINEWGNELNEEYGKGKKKSSINTSATSGAKTILASGVNAFGNIVSSIIPLIRRLFKPLISIVAIVLVFSIGTAWLASIFGITYAAPAINVLGPKNSAISYLGMFSFTIIFAIPLLGLLLSVIRLAWSYRIHKNVKTGLWTVWFLSIFTSSFAGMKLLREYQSKYDYSQISDFNITEPEIRLSGVEKSNRDFGVILGPIHFINDDKTYVYENAHVKIERSKDNLLHIEKHITSHGENKAEAQANALAIKNHYVHNGNTFTFDHDILLPTEQKFRAQNVEYTIYVPIGKKVILDEPMKGIISHSDVIPWDKLYKEGVNEWMITTSGASSSQYDDIVNFTKDIVVSDFDKLIVENSLEVEIQKGKTNSIKLIGPKEYVDKITYGFTDKMFHIAAEDQDDFSEVKLLIEVTNPLELIHLDNISKASIKGFDQDMLKIISNGGKWDPEILFDGKIGKIDIYANKSQDFKMIGTADFMKLKINGDATIEADKFIVKKAEVIGTAGDHSDSEINVVESLSILPADQNIVNIGNAVAPSSTIKNI